MVIEPKEAETMTAGGLYIPDNAKEKPQQGVIVAVGPGSKDEPMEVKEGESIITNRSQGTREGQRASKTTAILESRYPYFGYSIRNHQRTR